MQNKPLTLFAGVILLILLSVASWYVFQVASSPTQSSNNLTPIAANPRLGGDFTLASLEGPVSLSDFRGKVAIVYFGYTYCPDICHMAMAILASTFEQLTEAQREQVQGILVSVDPERDTLEHLKEYTAFFSPHIIGITGEDTQLQAITKQYGAFYRRVEIDSAMEYAMDHTSRFYIINQQGQLAAAVTHDIKPLDLQKLLLELL